MRNKRARKIKMSTINYILSSELDQLTVDRMINHILNGHERRELNAERIIQDIKRRASKESPA